MEDSKDPFAGSFPTCRTMEDDFPFLKKQRQEQEKLKNETPAKQKQEQERQALNELKAAKALRDKFALYAMHAMLTFGDTQGRNPQHISSVSYNIADAMLGKRNEQKEKEE